MLNLMLPLCNIQLRSNRRDELTDADDTGYSGAFRIRRLPAGQAGGEDGQNRLPLEPPGWHALLLSCAPSCGKK